MPDGTLVDADGDTFTEQPDGSFVDADGNPVAVQSIPGNTGLIDERDRPITRFPNGTLIDVDGHQLTVTPDGRILDPAGVSCALQSITKNFIQNPIDVQFGATAFVPPDLRTRAGIFLSRQLRTFELRCLPTGFLFQFKSDTPFNGVILAYPSKSSAFVPPHCMEDYSVQPELLSSLYIEHKKCGATLVKKVNAFFACHYNKKRFGFSLLLAEYVLPLLFTCNVDATLSHEATEHSVYNATTTPQALMVSGRFWAQSYQFFASCKQPHLF